MKKTILAAVVLALLSFAGIAVAHGLDRTQSASAVNATFTATRTGSTDTRTCTTAAGKTIAVTKATYTGTASGSADLTGPVTIAARSTIDTTTGVGVVSGTLRIGASGGKTEAHFTGVYDHGSIAGTASGHGAPHTQLLANLSAGYSAAGGFSNGKIGGGTAGGSAVELSSVGCGTPPPPPSHNGNKASGAIVAVSAASITVGGLTCAVPASLAIKVAASFTVGERVEITCSDVSGTMTLVKIEQKH